MLCFLFFFFFQAEDGIRDYKVTGVQTCALPISRQRDVILSATSAMCASASAESAEPFTKTSTCGTSGLSGLATAMTWSSHLIGVLESSAFAPAPAGADHQRDLLRRSCATTLGRGTRRRRCCSACRQA